jgi:RHS repeat-associated protein
MRSAITIRATRFYKAISKYQRGGRGFRHISHRVMGMMFIVALLVSMLSPLATPLANALAAEKTLRPLDQADRQSWTPPQLSAVDEKVQQDYKPTNWINPSDVQPDRSKLHRGAPTGETPLDVHNTKTTFDDGSFKIRSGVSTINEQTDKGLKKKDTNLQEDAAYAQKTRVQDKSLSRFLPGKDTIAGRSYMASSSELAVDFQSFFGDDGVRLRAGDRTVTIRPIGGNDSIVPITKEVKSSNPSQPNTTFVIYQDVWKDVDLQYEFTGEKVKEYIVVKSADAPTVYPFKVDGGEVVAVDKDAQTGEVTYGIKDSNILLGQLSVSLNKQGIVSDAPLKLAARDNIVSVFLDADWVASLPKDAFPAVIDPDYYTRTNIGGDYGSYWNKKSDGYACGPSNCWMNAGSLIQSGTGKVMWHTAFKAPYGQINGKYLDGAWVHLGMKFAPNLWSGYTENHWINISWLPDFTWNYGGGGAPVIGGWMGTDNWFDVTSIYQWLQSRNDYGGWLVVWGEEWNATSYKALDPSATVLDTYYADYNARPTVPGLVAPIDRQVFTDLQPSFKMNASTDGNGDLLKYYFRVMGAKPGDCNSATNTLVESGEIDSVQWTVPDGVLRDGEKYWFCGYVHDNAETTYHYGGGNYWNWTAPVEFSVDLRLGKDKTQTYDTAGPFSINFGTGNTTMSASSHTMNALGGSMGVGLEYNSPLMSRPGLVASYFNNGNLSGSPVLTRNEGNVEFNWQLGSPAPGYLGNDNFSARWEGYFIAPETATYQFGATNDDNVTVTVNNTQAYTSSCCQGAVQFGTQTVSLTAGQVVPIKIEYAEVGSNAYVSTYVKFNGMSYIIPKEWLRTEPQLTRDGNGLMGRYYRMEANEPLNMPTDNRQPFMTRLDNVVNFDWAAASPVSGAPVDRFTVRWTGYVMVPQGTDYQFCVRSDDGVRIYFDNQLYAEAWVDRGMTQTCGATQTWAQSQIKAVTIEYYEKDYNAGAQFQVNYLGQPTQTVPNSWLLPSAKVLPNGWSLGVDPDGNLSYESMLATTTGVTLYDNGGEKHFYASTGSGYKPPVNEDGVLVRNTDGTYTLQDTDGRTYEFNTAGALTRVTTPPDDRQPAALKYEYGGTPAHIQKISDGVDPSRAVNVYYAGDSQCGAIPSGLDPTPAGMLCAVKSTDGRVTNFYYKDFQLVRIEAPGGVITDLGYDEKGRIAKVREPLANDAVLAGVRSSGDDITTQLTYDAIGRAISATLPAANSGDTRMVRSYDYTPGITQPLYRHYQPSGPTTHILSTNSSWPGSPEAWRMIYVFRNLQPGTRAIYSCQRPTGQYFAGTDPNCYGNGNAMRSVLGYLYTQPTGDATIPLSRLRGSDGYVLEYPATSLAGWTTEEVLGYGFAVDKFAGSTKMHLTPSTEPNGYTDKVEYDNLYRITKDYDIAGQFTTMQWDPVKDLQLSSTDPTGLTSTTIYDINDHPTDTYGPAPSAWFGLDRKPTSSYVSQVPHTETKYDENIVGPAVAWYGTKISSSGQPYFSGAPKAHTTGLMTASPVTMRTDYRSTPLPITVGADNDSWGYSATGKIRFPGSGTYTFKTWHDDAVRVWVNDQLIIDDWGYVGESQKASTGVFTAVAGQPYRFRFDFANRNSVFVEDIWLAGPSIADQSGGQGLGTRDWNFLSADYSLPTFTKSYDSTIGDVTNATNYGSNPELGLAQSSTVDPTGLNLTGSATYEAQGAAGSFLRQTAKYLPGANPSVASTGTQYTYYTATDTRDNPCTTGTTEAYKQAGFIKSKTEADPDGAGSQVGRTTESIYDDAGRTVASRMNTDPWTCTGYDTRGRATQTVLPTINGRAGRTVTTTYNYQGSPFKTQTVDSVAGTTVSEIDLLGRAVSSTDQFGNVSTVSYDAVGRTSNKTTPLGTQTYTYDSLNRPTTYVIDGTTYATVTYDAYSRVQDITYDQAKDASNNKLKLEQIKRDALQRNTGAVFRFSNNQAYDETVTRTQSGMVSGYTDAYNGSSVANTYTYDKAGRLTQAVVDKNKYDYSYAAPSSSVCSQGNANLNAHKNTNRTSFTQTNTVTSQVITSATYCYDYADRLIGSSDTQLGTPTYDDHGNTISLAGNGTPITFTYDASDNNVKVEQGNNKIEYVKTASGSILRKKEYQNGSLAKNYRYVVGGAILQSCSLTDDNSCTTTDTYLGLPGGVTLTLSPTNPDTSKQTVYSLKNFHGDAAITASATGTPTSSIFLYEPFGQASASQTFGTNSNPTNSTNESMGWAANPTRKVEGLFSLPIIQMGARVYLPTTGRFLQVDPVEGGTANNYVYPGDPVNSADYSGQFAWALAIYAVPGVGEVAAAATVAVAAAVALGAGAYYGAKAVRNYVDSRTNTKTTTTSANPANGCTSYKPASPPTYNRPATNAASRISPAVATSLLMVQISLSAGYKPGAPRMGNGTNYPMEDLKYGSRWTKYEYKVGDNDRGAPYEKIRIHYNVLEWPECVYDDLKAK